MTLDDLEQMIEDEFILGAVIAVHKHSGRSLKASKDQVDHFIAHQKWPSASSVLLPSPFVFTQHQLSIENSPAADTKCFKHHLTVRVHDQLLQLLIAQDSDGSAAHCHRIREVAGTRSTVPVDDPWALSLIEWMCQRTGRELYDPGEWSELLST